MVRKLTKKLSEKARASALERCRGAARTFLRHSGLPADLLATITAEAKQMQRETDREMERTSNGGATADQKIMRLIYRPGQLSNESLAKLQGLERDLTARCIGGRIRPPQEEHWKLEARKVLAKHSRRLRSAGQIASVKRAPKRVQATLTNMDERIWGSGSPFRPRMKEKVAATGARVP